MCRGSGPRKKKKERKKKWRKRNFNELEAIFEELEGAPYITSLQREFQ